MELCIVNHFLVNAKKYYYSPQSCGVWSQESPRARLEIILLTWCTILGLTLRAEPSSKAARLIQFRTWSYRYYRDLMNVLYSYFQSFLLSTQKSLAFSSPYHFLTLHSTQHRLRGGQSLQRKFLRTGYTVRLGTSRGIIKNFAVSCGNDNSNSSIWVLSSLSYDTLASNNNWLF